MLNLALGVGGDEDVARFELRGLGTPLNIRKGNIRSCGVNDVGELALLHIEDPDLTILTRTRNVLVLEVELGTIDLGVGLTQTPSMCDLDGSFGVMFDGLGIADGSLLLNLMCFFLGLLLTLPLFACLFH